MGARMGRRSSVFAFSLGTITLSCVKDCFYYLKVGQTWFVVGEASNGREAVDLWKEHRPDVTLLDLQMPVLDGVGAIKQIREVDPNAHIVVLTTFDGDEDIYQAIKAGAKGYLLKDATREALMDCIHKVHIGETSIPSILAAKLVDRVSGEALSAREIEVLQKIAAGKANKEISAELFIGEGTVKAHVKTIFRKLDVVSRTEAVARATRRGLIRLLAIGLAELSSSRLPA
jgi:DNA-binding NarL/FixJ family response regulator